MRRLDDPKLVAREYASAERYVDRQLAATAEILGDDPTELALAALAEVEPRRVLDAGCGDGGFAARIDVPEVVAVDLSPAMVELARARGVDARVADIQELPFAGDSFDAVTCNWVLYHLPDLDSGLAELFRVLRSGGRLVAITNGDRHLREVWDAVGDPWPRHGFDCELGEAALARHFGRVESRPSEGAAVWPTRDSLQQYLDAFSELGGELEAPSGPYPLRATRRNCILVGDKA